MTENDYITVRTLHGIENARNCLYTLIDSSVFYDDIADIIKDVNNKLYMASCLLQERINIEDE